MEKRALTKSDGIDAAAGVRGFQLKAGTLYGALFAVGFAVSCWGYDAVLLATHSADFAWAKFTLGLPAALILGSLAGWLAALASAPLLSVLLWAGVGGALGLLAGHLPFEGRSLLAGLLDAHFRDVTLLPFGYAARIRTLIISLIMAVFGAGVGLLENPVIEWAWDRSVDSRRLSLGSWLMLLLAVLLALPFTLLADHFIQQPLRRPRINVATVIEYVIAGERAEALAAGVDYRVVAPFRGALSDDYRLYLVDFLSEAETMHAVYVDAAFESGLLLRCSTVGSRRVTYCGELGTQLEAWMADLVHAGLTLERRWVAPDAKGELQVDEAAVAWLERHREQLQGTYTVDVLARKGGVIWVGARFDEGFAMKCRFRGGGVMQVDRCEESSTDTAVGRRD